MVAVKSPRNRTIDTSLSEGLEYLQRCISLDEQVSDISTVVNRTILGDTFAILRLLPHNSVDLLIVDPPYNLAKTYGNSKFSRKSSCAYEAYTHQWLSLAATLLKETGSIYVCCDWESSLTIGQLLSGYFRIRSRITWQREKGRGARANWKNGLEDIWYATKSDRYTFPA